MSAALYNPSVTRSTTVSSHYGTPLGEGCTGTHVSLANATPHAGVSVDATVVDGHTYPCALDATEKTMFIFHRHSGGGYLPTNEPGLPLSNSSIVLGMSREHQQQQYDARSEALLPVLLTSVTEVLYKPDSKYTGFRYLSSWFIRNFEYAYVIVERQVPRASVEVNADATYPGLEAHDAHSHVHETSHASPISENWNAKSPSSSFSSKSQRMLQDAATLADSPTTTNVSSSSSSSYTMHETPKLMSPKRARPGTGNFATKARKLRSRALTSSSISSYIVEHAIHRETPAVKWEISSPSPPAIGAPAASTSNLAVAVEGKDDTSSHDTVAVVKKEEPAEDDKSAIKAGEDSTDDEDRVSLPDIVFCPETGYLRY